MSVPCLSLCERWPSAARTERVNKKDCKALSVTCGDSSPKGRNGAYRTDTLHELFYGKGRFLFALYSFACFMDRLMRFFFSSTSSTITFTMSPTDTTSEGCLMNRLHTWEMCTSPS